MRRHSYRNQSIVRRTGSVGGIPPIFLAGLLSLALCAVVRAQLPTPNDPLYPQQWALRLLAAECIWHYGLGSTEITVAVVDSGVDAGHPDLAERLRNDGFDFVDNDADPADENGHGTHVAGIIAATLGNAEGISGLAPGVRILPVRVMDAEGYGSDRSIAAGIEYAADRGARVINLSLGATLLLAAPESSAVVSRAIRNAQNAGALIVVAAGNDFVPLPNAIVGENDDVVVVAASDRNDRKTDFSNSGPWIDVTAPGQGILSTMPTYPVYLTSPALPPAERFQPNYDTMSGTSQAAPFVAALAALIFSAHPDWSADQVIAAIKTHAVDVYDRHPSYYERLRLLGAGRIDGCATLGGLPEGVAPVSVPLPGAPALTTIALVIAGSGLCLLLVVFAGSTLLLQRRRQRAASKPAPASAGSWGRLHLIKDTMLASSFALAQPAYVIGRSIDADLSIEGDPRMSRRHARLSYQAGQYLLEDLGSSYGTLLNGRPINGPTRIQPGDRIQLGGTVLQFNRY